MKLSEYAKINSLTYQAAWNQFKNGQIPNARQLPTGTIIVDEIREETKQEYNVIYARVSSSENKSNLESQADRLCFYCIAKGWKVNEVVKECASGLNDNRSKLCKILKERKATRLIIEHKDRLTRFGFNYIKILYPECDIIVVNECENKRDLFENFVSLVTNFCARIYGQRRTKRKTEQTINCLKEDSNNSYSTD